MAVDRGGLRYEIRVIVRNLRRLRSFRTELTRTLKETRRVTAEQVQRAKGLSQIVIAEARARKELERANEAAAKARLAEQRLRTERQRTVGQIRRAILAEVQLARARARASREQEKVRQTTRRFNRTLRRTETTANRISFTFRRLFGIFAAFAAVRQVAAGLRSVITEGIRFNQFVEEARLGIQALLAATGEVFGPNGVALQGLEKFNAVADIASSQLEKLRLDARNTAATFQTLLETFQIALGPGLAAGLEPDQIRRLTVSISQAAAAIGLPQNQLAEEIRSLLTGTIQPRTTRIATVLGITNEDVRRAREAGNLADFLNERFAAFGEAAADALGNLRVLLTNARDDLARLLGTKTEQFFNELKAGVAGFRAELQGAEAEEFALALNDALLATLGIFREFASGVGFETLAELIEALTVGLRGALEIVARLAASFVRGFATALTVVSRVADVLSRIVGIFDGALAFLLQWVVAFRLTRGLLVFIFQSALGVGQALGRAAVAANALAAGTKGAAAGMAASALGAGRIAGFLAGAGRVLRIITGFAARLAGWISLVLIGAELIFGFFSDSAEETEKTVDNLEAYRNVSGRIPPLIAAANKELEKAAEETKKVREEAEKLAGAFDIALAARGIGDIGQRAVQIVLEGTQRVQQEVLRLDEQREQKLAEIAQQQETLLNNEREIRSIAGDRLEDLSSVTDAIRAQLQVEQRINADLRRRRNLISAANQTRDEGTRETLRQQAEAARQRAEQEQRVADALAARRREEIVRLAGGDDTAQQNLVRLAEQRVEVQQRINALRAQESEIAGQLRDREAAIRSVTDQRLGTFLVEQNARLREQNAELRNEVEERRRVNIEIEKGTDARLARLNSERRELIRNREEQVALNNATISALRARREEVTDARALREIDAAIAELRERNRLITEETREALSENVSKLNDVGRELRAVSRINPLSTILKLNPEQLRELDTAEKLLKPLADEVLELNRRAEDLETRRLLGPLAEDAIRVRDELRAGEDAQRKFAEQAEREADRLQTALANIANQRAAAIAQATAAFPRETGRSIIKTVDKALENSRIGDKLVREIAKTDPERATAITDLFQKLTKLAQEEKSVREELNSVEDARVEGARLLEEILKRRVALTEDELKLRSEIERRSLAARSRDIQAEATGLRQTDRQAQITAFDAQIESLEAEINVLAPNEEAEARLNELGQARLRVLREEIGLLEQRRALISGGADAGINRGIEEFIRNADSFEQASQLAQGALSDFSSALAQSLQAPEDAGQILLDFFKNLVNQILQLLIQLILAQALAGLGGGGATPFLGKGAGGVRLPFAGAVEGGLIGTHADAKGYAKGGDIHGARPRNLDPRDTVPIWAQPGEFMQPVKAVGYYGRQVMEALRTRSIPAPIMRMLASGVRLPSRAASVGPGFQTGGEIPNRNGARREATEVHITIDAPALVADGLSTENVRAVAPGIKEPRTLAEIKSRRNR